MNSQFLLSLFLIFVASSCGQTPVPVTKVIHHGTAPNLGKVWEKTLEFAQEEETKSVHEEVKEQQFGTVNFQGKAWLVDFQDGVNRVWTSEKGCDWTLVSKNVEFGHLPKDTLEADVTHTRFFSYKNGVVISKDITVGDLPNDPQEDKACYLAPKALFVFGGKLWLLGQRQWTDLAVTQDSRPGHATKNRKGFDGEEIWNSPDGVHWVQITNRANYYDPSQYFKQILVNDNGMFVITRNVYETQDKIWSSVTGDHWMKVGNTPYHVNLEGYWTGTFLGKLWIIGGFVRHEDIHHLNQWTYWRDIWSSTDGVHWKRAKDKLPFDPCIGLYLDNKLAVQDDRVYALGGQSLPSTGEPKPDQLWSSLDGIHWEAVNSTLPFKTIKDLAVLGNQFVMNYSDHGFENEDSAYWTSPDGAHWVLHTNEKALVLLEHGDSIGLGPRSILLHQGKLWIFDVTRDSWNYRRVIGDIWCSSDGESWQEVNNSIPRDLVLGIPLSFQNKLWVINDAIYSSEDGVIWKQTEPQYTTPPSGDETIKLYYPEDQAVVMDGRIFLLSRLSHKQALWVSGDGIHWDLANGALPMAMRQNSIFQVFNHQLWIIGGKAFDPYADDSDGDGELSIQRLADVWCSPDGVKWTQVTDWAPFGQTEGDQSMIVNDCMFVFAGKDHSRLWVTHDGENWTLVSQNPAFPKRNNAACVSFNGKLWLFGGMDSQRIPEPSNSVWCTP